MRVGIREKVKTYLPVVIVLISIILLAKITIPVSFGLKETTAIIENSLEKYINYNLSDQEQGTLVQYRIKTKIEYGENQEHIPVERTETKINFNPIDGKYPETIKMIEQKENYEYDANNGVLTIYEENQSENHEYVVISSYPTYTEEEPERNLQLKTFTQITLGEDNTTITADELLETNVTQNIGELTSIHSITDEVYNGYIKSNQINGTNYDTIYKEIEQITVSKKEAQESLEITQNNTFVKKQDETQEIGNNGNLVYVSTKIAKKDIINLLGEEGRIEILDNEQNAIASIDKDSQFSEEGTITISYEKEIENIIIKTSKIQNEGILRLEQTKKIKSDLNYQEDLRINTISQIGEVIYKNEILIQDAKTEINMEINNKNWTNQRQNDVIFTVNLNTTTIKNNLLKNPSIQIELPDQVEKVILGTSSIAYGNGLVLQDPYLETASNGTIKIIANLQGQQTVYEENALGLTGNIQIPATIILKKDIENTTESVNLLYNNQYTINGAIETGNKQIEIQVESYQEQKTTEVQQMTIPYQVARRVEEHIDSEAVQLEVAPIKGDVAISEGDTIYEGEYIKYQVKVTNTSDTVIKNVKIIGSVPEGTTYGELEADYYKSLGKYQYNFDETVKEKEIEIGTLKAGETVTEFYEVKVNDLEEGIEEKQIENSIKAYLAEQEVSSYQITNVVIPAEVQIFLKSELDNRKDKWNYIIETKGQKGQKVNVRLKFPEIYTPTSYIELGEEQYDEEENRYVYTKGNKYILKEEQIGENHEVILENITVGELYSIQGTMDSTNIVKNTETSKVELTAVAIIEKNETTYRSNENRIEFSFTNASITMTSSNEGEKIKYGEEIDYAITIKNTGRTNIDDEVYHVVSLKLKDYLPKEVNPVSVTYIEQTYEGSKVIAEEEVTKDISGVQTNVETGEKLPNVDLSFTIPYQETRVIKVKATAGYVYEKTEIENFATIQSIGDEQKVPLKTSNTIKHIILPYNYVEDPTNPDEPNHPDDPDDPNNPDVPSNPTDQYSISGVAWLDENEDGQRQESEKLLAGIPVAIFNARSGEIVSSILTNTNGSYHFSSLETNDYIVVFQYDTNTYSITEYRKSGVSSNSNSDAMNKNITIDGKQMTAGVTDTISLNVAINNMDIGLIKNKIRDLKLDKYVSKATVKTNKTNQQIDYHQTKLGKIEMKAKEIEGATVTIEYKLVVTNVGEAETIIGNLIDYLPDGFDFSTQNNKSWNRSQNGELINTSIANQKLKPGESAEAILLLTKNMNANGTGTFTNKAEIRENQDKDMSNNSSQADIIISVGTGIITYIGIAFIVLAIMVAGVFLIHKLGLIKVGKISLFLLMFVTIIVTQINQVEAEAPHETTQFWSTHPKGQGPNFAGGPGNEGGICIQHGVWSYSGTFHLASTIEVNTSESAHDDNVSFSLQKKNESIRIRLVNSDYILGPFKVECTAEGYNYDTGYTFYVYDNHGEQIDGYSTCDVNGNYMEARGTTTFYLKMPVGNQNKGIARVVISATKTGVKTRYYYKSEYANYKADPEVNGYRFSVINIKGQREWAGPEAQDVQAYRLFESSSTSIEPISESHSVEWTDIEGMLDIIKQDADNSDIKLSGVQVRLQGTGGIDYDRTFTTNREGRIHVEHLRAGTYRITEVSNPYYGYQVKESDTITVEKGIKREYSLVNAKYTGNLTIQKKDASNNTILNGVSFKIMNASGRYLIAIDSNNQEQAKVTGSICLSNFKLTNNENQATEFITDNSGKIEIINLKTGNYQVKEISVGNHYGYEVDDDYISWEANGKQPGNVNINDKKTYEDDSDKAPGLKLVLQEQRKTDGTIFIDKPLETNNFNVDMVNTGKTRQGNGIYDKDNEAVVSDVTVQLINMKTGEIADIYDETTKQWKKAEMKTKQDGSFSFEGFIPETYQLVYIWGGQTYTDKDGQKQKIRVQDYKGTIYQDKDRQQNLEWYKILEPRYSDAMDSYEAREKIDKQSTNITNANKQTIENYSGQIELENGAKEDIITQMASSTPNFRVNVEYATEPTNGKLKHVNYLQDIDFGIIERARQALALEKRIKRTKITLANGNILVDARVTEDGKLENDVKHAMYIPKSVGANGQIKIEVDNEILQGSRLEVEYQFKVKNVSELDYLNEDYYFYGEGRNNQQLSALDARTVIDYLDNKVSNNAQEESEGWYTYTNEEKVKLIEQDGLLGKVLKRTVNTTNTIMHTQNLSQKLQPIGKSEAETTMKVYKILPSVLEDEDAMVGNDTEIIKIIKSGGSTLTTIPGNYVLSEGVKEVDESKSEDITIVPPTGLSIDYIAYTLLAITSLGILITGIILIKKLVLR